MLPKQTPNQLDIFRRKMKLSQKHVAHLLGHRQTVAWSNYERGARLPSLPNALRLAIILRTPLEFLFYALFNDLHKQIRAEEERLTTEAAKATQQVLF
jgi:DNA-binding XRE family transcriptional regulator